MAAELLRCPPEEFAARRRRAAKAAVEAGWDGLLVAGRSAGTHDAHKNVHWLSRHSMAGVVTTPTGNWSAFGQDFVLVDGDGRGTLVSAGITEPPEIEDVRTSQDVEGLLSETIRDLGLGGARLGLAGSEVLPWTVSRRLALDFPELSLTPADLLLAKLRLALSPVDCDMLRQAARIGCEVLGAALAAAVPGATDGDVVAAGLADAARRPRVQHWDFAMSSGARSVHYCSSSFPMWDAATPYEPGDMVHPDCYGYVDGYAYDVQRTVVVGGRPSDRQRELIEGATRHVRELGQALHDGITPREVHRLGTELMRELGHVPPDRPDAWFSLVPHFGHGFATGFDWPWLGVEAPDPDEPLRAPTALTVEIPWEDDEVGGAYIEDEFLVLPDRVECLTEEVPLPMEATG
jgi:Xaa-Pro aminopeptidase